MIIYDDLPVVYDTGEILEDKTDWRTLKLKSFAVSKVMIGYEKSWLKRSERMLECGSLLRFAVSRQGDKRLISAQFCRDRMCPACQKRRSLAMFHQVKDVCLSIQSERKNTAYLLLTLTVPNVKADKLKDEITLMNKAWESLSRKVEFKKAILGSFKALEVTYNSKSKTYHPHFHILLAVTGSYFTSRYYINHSRWLELWQNATKNPLITQVDVRRVKPNPKRLGSTSIESAAAEVGKYATKPSDYISRVSEDEYKADSVIVRDLAICLKGRRLTSFAGLMKEHYIKLQLTDVEDDAADLVHVTGESDLIDAVMVQMYRWNVGFKQYIN
jgi:plasmid rolling circle replication initiator protein Rep